MNAFEHQSLESLENFKDLFDNAYDLIHLVYPDGTIMYVNKAWERILGYRQEEIQGRSINSIVVAADRAAFMEFREALLKGSLVDRPIVFKLCARSGQEITVEGRVSVRQKDGQPWYTRGIFRDITAWRTNELQLRQTNAALQERENNLRQLLTHAPDAVIVINAASVITFWNPKAVSMFGWTVDEVTGSQLADTIIPRQYREAHQKGMARYLAGGAATVLNQTVELTALHRNGNEFFISLTISETRQNGKPAFIAFIRNIDLEKRNALELEKKRKELETSNEELEDFAHVASHDMKEPVRKIRIFADQLGMDSGAVLSPKAKIFLQKIENAADRLSKMIEGILDHSSVSTAVTGKEKIDLNEILGQVLIDLELLVQEKKAELYADNLPRIEGSSFLIYQLFYNLISNSLKFSRPGIPPVIRVAARNADAEGPVPHVIITIHDNGIGFPNKQAAHIFKKFSRLHPKDNFEGTGLGLSLCRRIVEKHKGSITASSEENRGATFTISLPVSQ